MSEMTATRIGRSATIAVVAAAVAVWLLAAYFLLRTKVPGNLDPPHLDAERVFGRGVTHAGARFDRFFDYTWVLGTIVSLAALAVYLRRGPRLVRRLPLG